jgi:hypothetical protein
MRTAAVVIRTALSFFPVATLALAGVVVCAAPAVAGPAQFVIVNVDPPGVGLNDPTPAVPIGGNTGTTRGQQRLIVLEHAAAIWSARLDSSVPIRIRASFVPFGGGGTIGQASAGWVYRDFPNTPLPGVFYPTALANKLAGFDLDTDPGEFGDDMTVTLNTEFDFYLGLDNDHGPRVDLVTILLHEMGHALGVASWAVTTRAMDIYSRYMLDTALGLTWNEMTAAQRATSATQFDGLVWNGDGVTAAVPAVLSFGTSTVAVTGPAALARPYAFSRAAFGPPVGSPAVAGPIVEAIDSVDDGLNDACSPITNAAAVAGRIALIQRGPCSYAIQARRASEAGAAAVIIYNDAANANGGLPFLGDDGINGAFVTVPTVGLDRADGLAIVAELANGVSAHLFVDQSIRAGADTLGRARLYAPRAFFAGSSLSHYDVSAFRNVLMEPFLNDDLTHTVKAPFDLTSELLYDLGWTFPDADGDGIADDEDCQAATDTRPTIVIGTLDSGVPNVRFTGGCSAADLISKLKAESTNRGSFLSPLAHLTNEWVANGTYTDIQKGAIQSTAARAK